MAQKFYNCQTFDATIDGVNYLFSCYTTHTRNGFCHHIVTYTPDFHTRVSYFGRTWESFDYESALKRHFEKFGKNLCAALTREIIDRKNAEINGRLAEFEKSLKAFAENLQKVREARPDAYKNAEVNNESEAAAVMACVALEALTV